MFPPWCPSLLCWQRFWKLLAGILAERQGKHIRTRGWSRREVKGKQTPSNEKQGLNKICSKKNVDPDSCASLKTTEHQAPSGHSVSVCPTYGSLTFVFYFIFLIQHTHNKLPLLRTWELRLWEHQVKGRVILYLLLSIGAYMYTLFENSSIL